ncbi:MAG TPA: hypothetical protein VNM24_17255 [Burkholderiales bacterium]|jgi:hypothetical protein|nr:hypothetical protein [Burkholderiales bacterium]
MTRLRRALSLLLPLLLLLAQHGALAHLVSHLDPDQTPAHERTLVHLKLCGKCIGAEKLTHLAAARVPAALGNGAVYSPAVVAGYACTPQAWFGYSSRAPPSVL